MSGKSKIYDIRKPSIALSLTEGLRAIVDLGCYVPYRFFKKKSNLANQGDGHPVLILPGFMASDLSTIPLRSFINDLGYKVYGWGEGRNYAHADYLDLLSEKLERIYSKHGEQITLIGWSLGGIYARQLAKKDPSIIRQIINMGSPIQGVNLSNNATWMFELLKKSKLTSEIDKDLLKDIPAIAPVPTTAIFTKEDGVVPWELCLEKEDNWHQNVQVRGSHLGLGVNPLVLQIVADRLTKNRSTWNYFETSNLIEDLLVIPEAS